MFVQEDEPSGCGGCGGETAGAEIPGSRDGCERDPRPCPARSDGGGDANAAHSSSESSIDLATESAESSRDPILRQAQDVLIKFIVDQALSEEGAEGLTAECLGVSDEQLEDRRVIEVANCLKKIADELENNAKLQQLIQSISVSSPKEYLFGVACKLFDDGIFNWGRVAALFYFAYKLVIRAYINCVPEHVRTILGWSLELIKLYFVPWIKQQGGWEAVIVYVRRAACLSQTVKMATLVLSLYLVYRKLRKP